MTDSLVTGRPTVDGGRLLARLTELAAIGATARGGVTRQAYGPLDVEARTLVAGWMADAGLEVEVDAATNLVGRLAGQRGDGRALASGSHLDTVVEAGALDGAYGVLAAVEAAGALARSDAELAHDLVVVAFANEEGARGTDGMVGSRALMGEVPATELAALDDEGVTLAARLTDAGGRPARIGKAAWDPASIAAFVELHVEQGPVLDAAHRHLGVVTGITGRQTVDIDVRGAPNHAGTTPMDLRRDALTAAAEVVLTIEAIGRDGTVRVATCGHLQVSPNVRNVVPGEVRVSAELRDQDTDVLAAARPVVEQAVAAIAERRGIAVTVTWGQLVPPTVADPTVVEVIGQVAERSGLPWLALPSGAGHDAQILGRHLPIGMIFVPSLGGISHAPEEQTVDAHLVAGAQALLDSLLALDTRLRLTGADAEAAVDP